IGAALDVPSHPNQGHDVGEVAGLVKLDVKVTAELPISTRLDVMIDFSSPQGTMAILSICVARRIPLIIATTGHTSQQSARIEEAAHETALLFSPNLSLAVNTLFKFVQQAAKILRDGGFDVEIVERHHRFKKDSPSGTALHFAKMVQETMGQTDLRHGREGGVG